MPDPDKPSSLPDGSRKADGRKRQFWRVTAWLWERDTPDADCGIGAEIETHHVEDKELAMAAAHILIDRHADKVSPVTEIDVSVTGPLELEPGDTSLVPSIKEGRMTEEDGSTCRSA